MNPYETIKCERQLPCTRRNKIDIHAQLNPQDTNDLLIWHPKYRKVRFLDKGYTIALMSQTHNLCLDLFFA